MTEASSVAFALSSNACKARAGGATAALKTSSEAAPAKTRTAPSGAGQGTKAAPSTASKPQQAPATSKEQPAKQVAPASPPATPQPTPQAARQQDPAQKFAAARDLVLAGQYEAGIAALRALGFDEHPDVAAYVGFAHSKLGRFAEATSWYDKALAGNPNHLLTLSYYGMSSVEQDDLRTAHDALERIKQLCGGTGCKEYIALDATIASKKR